jgi:hypothetical protein
MLPGPAAPTTLDRKEAADLKQIMPSSSKHLMKGDKRVDFDLHAVLI